MPIENTHHQHKHMLRSRIRQATLKPLRTVKMSTIASSSRLPIKVEMTSDAICKSTLRPYHPPYLALKCHINRSLLLHRLPKPQQSHFPRNPLLTHRRLPRIQTLPTRPNTHRQTRSKAREICAEVWSGESGGDGEADDR